MQGVKNGARINLEPNHQDQPGPEAKVILDVDANAGENEKWWNDGNLRLASLLLTLNLPAVMR